MPCAALLNTMNTIHRTVFRASGGRLLGRVGGMLVVDLHTVGRKSGQPRSSMLTSPIQNGDEIVLVASRGGDPQHPAWYHNLRANPDVEITVGGDRKPMRARVASPEERAELWPKVTSRYKGYAAYQTKTTREIPLVILSPR